MLVGGKLSGQLEITTTTMTISRKAGRSYFVLGLEYCSRKCKCLRCEV